MLTKKQNEVLKFIHLQIKRTGCAPSYAEIAAHTGLTSRGRVSYLVSALEERGFVSRRPGRQRSIEVLRPPAGDATVAPVILKDLLSIVSADAMPAQAFQAALDLLKHYARKLPRPARSDLVDQAALELFATKDEP